MWKKVGEYGERCIIKSKGGRAFPIDTGMYLTIRSRNTFRQRYDIKSDDVTNTNRDYNETLLPQNSTIHVIATGTVDAFSSF